VKPFVYEPDSPSLVTLEELGEAMKMATSRDGGFYADEVRWWKEAYERMMQDKGDAITKCYHKY
jgi:glycogenin glucosyltransferase